MRAARVVSSLLGVAISVGACANLLALDDVHYVDASADGGLRGGDVLAAETSGGVEAGSRTLTLGEPDILSVDDSANGDLLLGQVAVLAERATLVSLSFHVTVAAGTLRLGLYDATGPGGRPGTKQAETAEFVAKVDWNTVGVDAQVSLVPGAYWLVYLASSDELHVRKSATSGSYAGYPFPHGPLPQTFSSSPVLYGSEHWSFYATLTP